MKYQITIIFLLNFITFSLSQVLYNLIGGVTESSFQIKGKVKSNSVLKLYKDQVMIMSSNPDKNLFYSINVTGLNASEVHEYKLEQNSEFVTFNVMNFPTPGSSGNLSFIAGSNMYTATNSYIFDRITSKNPSFFMLLGNLFSSGGAKEESFTKGK
jgi:hypothetical protein